MYWYNQNYNVNPFFYNGNCYDYYQRQDTGSVVTRSIFDLSNTMRLAWEQHVYWTRMMIISVVFNLPDVDLVIKRLLQNPAFMGNILKPYYGERAGSMYTQLIKEHLVIGAEIVKAARKGEKQKVVNLEKEWHENGIKVAEFLSGINPFISEEGFQKMWFKHLSLTTQEAVQMIKGDYQGSIETFNEIEAEALEMADTITFAITKQFPNMFRG